MSSTSEMAVHGPRVGAQLRMLWSQVWGRIHADLVAQGYADIGPSHVTVFRYPGPDGARPSELAERLQTTKQAVNYLLAYLESRGYLCRDPDPLDGRSRIVRLTEQGEALMTTILASIEALEREWEARIGSRRWREFLATLADLRETASESGSAALESAPAPRGAPGGTARPAQRATGAATSRPSSLPR
jgi:DNA-binding MarR family transcriptional regulator